MKTKPKSLPYHARAGVKQALHFLIATQETLGDTWLHNTRYRFGASALLNDLPRQIEKERTGAYQAPYVFSDATEGY
jgi:deoxyribose-phosphate aldolase